MDPEDQIEDDETTQKEPLDAQAPGIQEAPELLPKIYTDKKVLERASAFVLEQYRKYKDDHDSRCQKWIEFDQAYQNIRNRTSEDGANIVDPEPFVVVETLASNVSEAFFSQDPPFKYSPQEETDEDQAQMMSAYRADHIRRIGLKEKFERSVRQSEITGTFIVKTPWRKEVVMKVVRRKFEEVDPETGKVTVKTETKKVPFPKYDDMDWEFVSVFDFIPCGKGKDIEELDGVIHRVCKTYDEIKANERKTKEIDGIKVTEGMYTGLSDLDIQSTKINLLEYWGRIPHYIATGKDEDKYTTFEGVISCCIDEKDYNKQQLEAHRDLKSGGLSWIADEDEGKMYSSVAIRCQENPFWAGDRPFLNFAWTPVDNDFYGIGVIQPIKELWDELNDTRNQLVDNKTLMLRQPMLEDVHANVQRNVNLTGKNVRIKCDDINGVKPLMIQNFQAEGWRNVAAIKDDIRRATAAVESLQGVPLSGSTSATEFSAVQQQAGIRLKSIIRRLDEVFKKWLDRAYQYDQQFAEFERFVKVLGEDGAKFVRINPEDINGTFDIITNGVTTLENSVIKANKLTNMLSIVSKIPPGSPLWNLVKEIWKTMGLSEAVAEQVMPMKKEDKPEDVEKENLAIQTGQPIIVRQQENHQMHIQLHGQELEKIRSQGLSSPEIEQAFMSHIAQHAFMLKAQMSQMPQAPQGQGQLNQLAQNGAPVPHPDIGMPPMQAESPMEEVAQ